ncbi:MAG: hypothetical protein K6T86_06560 [Pirellulales bacterium]|nr:hypothetical protein [Pirellulales bacterium]
MADALAATLVVGAVGVVALTMAAAGSKVGRQQRARLAALLEAENILQRLTALEPRELAPTEDKGRLSPEIYQTLDRRLQERLPGARLEVLLQPLAAPLLGQQVTVIVTVPARPPEAGAIVRLSAWTFWAAEDSP